MGPIVSGRGGRRAPPRYPGGVSVVRRERREGTRAVAAPPRAAQRIGRRTLSRAGGPGVASAIQGPSPEGSITPSSSQV